MENRSTCPISIALEVVGDKWSLLVIRDLLFTEKRTFSEFLASDEKISTNILTDRLVLLESEGIIRKRKDEHHRQKVIYTLTDKGLDLLPLILELGAWSGKHYKVPSWAKAHIRKLKGSGPDGLKAFRQQLRKAHQ
ncbi:winged helix-turn-helix transcriptional regulator [Chitinophaga lutea]